MPEPPHTLTWGDRIVSAHKFDGTRKKIWAKWLFRLYREIETETKEDITEEEYRTRLDELDDLYARGEFGILSERGAAIARTQTGSLKLTEIIFELPEDEALNLMTAQPVEVGQMIRIILHESFPGLKEAEIEAKRKEAEQEAELKAEAERRREAGLPPKEPDPKVKAPASYVPLRRRARLQSGLSSSITST